MSLPPELAADVQTISRIDAVPAILDVVCRATGMGFAAVARVTEDRWVVCSVLDAISFGLLPGGELKVESTICNEIRDSRQAVIINHVAQDPLFATHHTPAQYGFQSYISMPIVLGNGTFFGTLCAIDPHPRILKTPETIGMFKLFAELIAFHIGAQQQLAASEAALLTAQQSAELREQFIAVLGHDLRNPVASITAGSQMLLRSVTDDKSRVILDLICSSANRMSALIEDVLDFARGRLGGGLQLGKIEAKPLKPVLEQVIAELRSSHPDHLIEATFGPDVPIKSDPSRIGQLLSNLIANALTHGASDAPVQIQSACHDGILEISVSNRGEPIPPAAMQDLFKPFFRAARRPSMQGLGLGLYIAAEIARAHHGTLTATSSPEQTRFTFRMPVG